MGNNKLLCYLFCGWTLFSVSIVWAQENTGIDWTTDYSGGLELSVKEQKPVLVDFYADWCGPCKMMDAQVYSDPKVMTALKEFVTIKIDVDREEKVAYAYRIKSIPRTVVLNVHGEMIGDMVGFMPVDEFLDFLKEVKKDALKKINGIVISVPTDIFGTSGGGSRFSDTTTTDALLESVCSQDVKIRKAAHAEILTRDTKTIDQSIETLLADNYLGARIAGFYLLSQQHPDAEKAFDPWASKDERAEMLQQFLKK